MRRIERTNVFRRDFKREQRGQHRRDLEALISFIVALLAEDRPIPAMNHDHALGGEWQDHRECHLKPDLLLIYRKPDVEVLQLVRLAHTASFLASDSCSTGAWHLEPAP
jgi:mRNA interferase YafQ